MRLNHLAPTRQLFHQLCFRPPHTFAAAICIKFDSAEKPTVHPSRASGVFPLYAGFFLYGIGMGGTSILAEMIWANYFGRISLGKIRGMGSLLTHAFSAGGPPFFRFSLRRHQELSSFL